METKRILVIFFLGLLLFIGLIVTLVYLLPSTDSDSEYNKKSGSSKGSEDNKPNSSNSNEVSKCIENQYVLNKKCTPCPPGKTAPAGSDESGENTSCENILCRVNEKVSSNACVPCPEGTTSNAGYIASGPNTECNSIICQPNHYVLNHSCVPCPTGKISIGGDDASGNDVNNCVDGPPPLNSMQISCSNEGNKDGKCFYRRRFDDVAFQSLNNGSNDKKLYMSTGGTQTDTTYLQFMPGKTVTNFIVDIYPMFYFSNKSFPENASIDIEIGIRNKTNKEKIFKVNSRTFKPSELKFKILGPEKISLSSLPLNYNNVAVIIKNTEHEAYINVTCTSSETINVPFMIVGTITLNNYPVKGYYVEDFTLKKCPKDSYCYNLDKFQCPPQTFSAEGASSESDCYP